MIGDAQHDNLMTDIPLDNLPPTDDFIFLGTDRGDTPTRTDALQNRAEILATARRLFHEQGITPVSMTTIAREANVGKGTLYRHFRSKGDLCIALLDNEQRELQNRTLAYLQDSPETPDVLLLWFVQELCSFVRCNRELLFAASLEGNEASPIIFHPPAHRWQWLTIHGLLRRTYVEGDVGYLADVIFALLDPRLYQFQVEVQGYDHERIVAGLVDVVRRLLFR